MAEKCKLYRIYRRMCDVYRETSFSENNVYKWTKHRFATLNLSEKKNGQYDRNA